MKYKPSRAEQIAGRLFVGASFLLLGLIFLPIVIVRFGPAAYWWFGAAVIILVLTTFGLLATWIFLIWLGNWALFQPVGVRLFFIGAALLVVTFIIFISSALLSTVRLVIPSFLDVVGIAAALLGMLLIIIGVGFMTGETIQRFRRKMRSARR